jgi:hypothetical protein
MYVGGREAKSAPQIAIPPMRPAGTSNPKNLIILLIPTTREAEFG